MKLIAATDLDQQPELRIYRELRDRAFREDNSFIADSPKVVKLLLEEGVQVKSLLACESFYRENEKLIRKCGCKNLYVADKALLQNIVGHRVHHGVMMHGTRPPMHTLQQLGPRIIILDNLSKHDNIGAIARSAAALGIDSLIISSSSPHPWGRRALRVSMGYICRLKVHICPDLPAALKDLQRQDYQLIAAETGEDSTDLKEFSPAEKWALILGNEGDGLSTATLQLCDESVQIEMDPGIKSFNVAIAASILIYQLRQKALC